MADPAEGIGCVVISSEPLLIRTVEELTPEWLGRGDRAAGRRAARQRADRHRPDEPQPPRHVPADGSERRDRVGGREARLDRSDQPRDRGRDGRLLPRDRVLPQPRGADRGAGAALPRWRSTTPPRDGSRSCSRTSPARPRATRSPAAASSRRGSAMRALARVHAPVLGDVALGARRLPEPAEPAHRGRAEGAAGRVRRAIRRPGRARAHGDVQSGSCPSGTVGRRADAAARARPRRLPARQPAVRAGDLQGRRLADGRVGSADARRSATSSATRCVVEDRRAHEQELVRLYYDELVRQRRHEPLLGAVLGADTGARAFAGIGMVVVATMMVERTERGDEMFMTWLARTAQQIIDLDALSLLPGAELGRRWCRCVPSPATRAATSPVPSRCGTSRGTSTRSATTSRWALYVRLGRLPESGSLPLHGRDLRPGAPVGDGRRPARAAAGVRRRLAGDRDRRAWRRRSCARRRSSGSA